MLEGLGGSVMLVIVGLLSLSATVQAAEVEVSADVDRRRVAANEAVKLTLTITSERQLVHVSAPQINLGVSVLIPAAYVPDLDVRLGLYRRLSSLATKVELEGFAAELIDRTVAAAKTLGAPNWVHSHYLKMQKQYHAAK